jgi:hypothetical protein
MKTILKNQKMRVFSLSIVLMSVLLGGVFMQSCSNEDDENYSDNNSIINSEELEEYIIADIEFQQAFNIFKKEIESIDLSKVKSVQNAKGVTVLYIPTSICIENKANLLNSKKKSLMVKFPQLNSFSPEVKQKYFRQSVANSSRISKKILESGININQPRLKGGNSEFFTGDNYCDYLAAQVASSNYVEVIVLIFANGASMAYIDDGATANGSSITLSQNTTTGYWYYSPYSTSNRVVTFIHTHTDSGNASDADRNNKLPGLNYQIYYSGYMYNY